MTALVLVRRVPQDSTRQRQATQGHHARSAAVVTTQHRQDHRAVRHALLGQGKRLSLSMCAVVIELASVFIVVRLTFFFKPTFGDSSISSIYASQRGKLWSRSLPRLPSREVLCQHGSVWVHELLRWYLFFSNRIIKLIDLQQLCSGLLLGERGKCVHCLPVRAVFSERLEFLPSYGLADTGTLRRLRERGVQHWRHRLRQVFHGPVPTVVRLHGLLVHQLQQRPLRVLFRVVELHGVSCWPQRHQHGRVVVWDLRCRQVPILYGRNVV